MHDSAQNWDHHVRQQQAEMKLMEPMELIPKLLGHEGKVQACLLDLLSHQGRSMHFIA